MSILTVVVAFPGSLFNSQGQLALDNLALRQQIAITPKALHPITAAGYVGCNWSFFCPRVETMLLPKSCNGRHHSPLTTTPSLRAGLGKTAPR